MKCEQMIKSSGHTRPVTFLVVDDDEVSVMAIKRALKSLRIVNPVEVACDGQAALDIMRGTDGRPPLEQPYLVTLDLNMPRMDGLEFLEEVRSDVALSRTIVFVLSTSDTPSDVAAAYQSNVAGYIVKDDLGDSLQAALEMIGAFSRIVELPR